MSNESNKPNESNNSKDAKDSKESKESNEKLLKMIKAMLAEKQKEKQNEPKSTDQHKFWKTQPVVRYEDKPVEQGPLKLQTLDEVPKQPQSLPTGFEWCTVDVTDEGHLAELYDLLYANYIEDDDEQFRFKYPAAFLRWALTPPGWNPEFAVGIRATESQKLLAFISGIPANLVVREAEIKAVEINFLCVHKKLRSKRLAPVMIKEVTRRVNLTEVWQALFTAATIIPTPVSTAQYYHRVIDWSKLYEVGFAHLPENSTPEEQIAQVEVKKVALEGFRKLELEDLPQVQKLLSEYLSKFQLYQKFDLDEMKHWFIPASKESPVMSYVVEENGVITDFISCYGLESTVLGNHKHDTIRIAYMFYYATQHEDLKERLTTLYEALLVKVKENNYDVLNALTAMDNPLVFENLNFKPGDGFLNYNLFNWKTPRIDGGIDNSVYEPAPGGLGVVLL